jgi:hypothetical protein
VTVAALERLNRYETSISAGGLTVHGHVGVMIGAIQGTEWNLLRLAADEGWHVPERETERFRGALADTGFAVRPRPYADSPPLFGMNAAAESVFL